MSDGCCDGCDDLGVAVGDTGPQGPAGADGFSELIIANMVFVSKNGNDSTGLAERLDKPFLTVAAAQAAASFGFTIHTFPGFYSGGNLGKDGVNYYFEDGYIYTGTVDWFGDAVTTTVVNCKISGFARGLNCGRMVFSQNLAAAGSSYSFFVRGWSTITTTVWATFNGSNISCEWIDEILATNLSVAGRVGRFQNQNAPAITSCKIYLKGPICRSINMISAQSNTTCVYDIKCYFDVDLKSTYGLPAASAIFDLQGYGGIIKLYHEGNILADGNLTANQDGSLFSSDGAGSLIESHSNITRTNSFESIFGRSKLASGSASASTGDIKHYGNVLTNGPIMYIRGTSTSGLELNGNYIGGAGAYNAPMIDAGLSASGSITVNGLVKNLNAGAAAHVIKKSVSGGGDFACKILQTSRLVVTNTACYCLTSDASAPTFKVYNGSASNVVIDPGAGVVVQQIASILTDINVS